jgi:hypothetical protein
MSHRSGSRITTDLVTLNCGQIKLVLPVVIIMAKYNVANREELGEVSSPGENAFKQ